MPWILIILTIAGTVIGLLLAQDRESMGLILGSMVGYLLGAHLNLRKQVQQLQRQVGPQVKPDTIAPQKQTSPPPTTSTSSPVVHTVSADNRQAVPENPFANNPLVLYIHNFFTDGNAVVRIGLLVLFFGVAFLLKYVSEHSMLPIELRLAGVFAAAIAMLWLGRRLAHKAGRRTYGLLIMGGAIGIMYLTVFAAARLYEVLPLSLALIVLIVLTVFGALLALLEDAKGLAIFSVAGAFLAPILTSSHSGNHVLLFSYFALINLGIFGIAWFKAWRELNLEGYLFTFVIGGLWGYQSYTAEHFASTEPFLILFFLMFVSISILFSKKRAPIYRDYVDATLVFGVPLASIVLQGFMVHETEYGMALSALTMGVFYTSTAFVLWRRQQENLRMLSESFFALGVAFATLAIPFAVDSQTTAAAWALEGAGIVWVGTRQRKTVQWGSGILLQLGAGWMFQDVFFYYQDTPFLNAAYLGTLLLAVGGLFSAYNLDRHQAELRGATRLKLPLIMLLWGLGWLYLGGLREIDVHDGVGRADEVRAALGFITLATIALHFVARRLQWQLGGRVVHGFMPAIVWFGLLLPFADFSMPLVSQLGYVIFPLAIASYYLFLKQREGNMGRIMHAAWHMFGTWWLYILIAYDLFWFINHKLDIGLAWAYSVWGLLPPMIALGIMRLSRGQSWPVGIHHQLYLSKVLSPLVLYSWYWVMTSSGFAGDSATIPYIPLLNPLELVTLFILLTGLLWILRLHRDGLGKGIFLSRRNLTILLGITAFVWLNAVIGRAVHHYADIPHDFDELFNALVFQMSVSVVWSLLALAMTYVAHRYHQRNLWITGMGLLVLVVLKLFFIDLANSGTIERIISFITVGVLMLVVGYVAPLPPARRDGEHV